VNVTWPQSRVVSLIARLIHESKEHGRGLVDEILVVAHAGDDGFEIVE
jgi:hypothetical protein